MRGRGWRTFIGPVLAALAALGLALGAGAAWAAAPVVTEFSAGISGTPHDVAAGPDGNVWFTESTPNAIGRITPAGVVTEFTTGITFAPASITAGPDGNLWFAEPGSGFGDLIGRITPAGDVTEFPAGAGGTLTRLAAGPDGNVWFVAGGSVRRITPAGVVDEPATGISCSHLTGITTGPDGNVWFAGCQEVGRVTPSGDLKEFPVGSTPYESPVVIVNGPDGNLWFSEGGAAGSGYGPKIGRVTTAGVVTHFSFAGEIWGLAAGPDGNLWFPGTLSGTIGRFTLAGAVGYVSAGITPDSWPTAITAGPDGNLWFTETGGRRIARMTPGEPPAPAFPYVPYTPAPSGGGSRSSLMSPLAVTLGRVATLHRGGRAHLVLRARNTSAAAVTGVVVKATLPNGIVIDPVSRAANQRIRKAALRFTAKGRVLTYKLGTLAPGRDVALSVNAAVTAHAPTGRRVMALRWWARDVRPWNGSGIMKVR